MNAKQVMKLGRLIESGYMCYTNYSGDLYAEHNTNPHYKIYKITERKRNRTIKKYYGVDEITNEVILFNTN